MTGLKFFVNTTKPMTKFRPYIYDKSLKFKPKPLLRPFVNTGPGADFTNRLKSVLGLKSNTKW